MVLRLPAIRREAPVLGIDFHAGRMRLVAGAVTRRTWQVQHCAACEWPPEALRAGRLRQFEAVAHALRELVAPLGARARVALALPEAPLRRRALAVPSGLRPWRWRAWVQAQAEQLGQAPAAALAFDVQPLQRPPLKVLLTVCPREVVEDWQGLAQAAGLELAWLDDRTQALHRALAWLAPAPEPGCDELVAEVSAGSCRLQRGGAGQGWQVQHLDSPHAAEGPWLGDGTTGRPLRRWLITDGSPGQPWMAWLQAQPGPPWQSPGVHQRRPGSAHAWPPDADAYLAAWGLALRRQAA